MLDRRMETFLTLCRVMNYRAAAQELHITQPAVTQQIHFLEEEYGCQLFTFKNRRLQKTEKGQILETYAISMKHSEEMLRGELGQKTVLELRVGATKTIGDYAITDQVSHFITNYNHSLTLIVDNTRNLLRMLDEKKLDFAIIEGTFDKRRYDWQLFRLEPFVGICNREHPFCGREVELSELLSQTIIHREEGSGTRAILEQVLQEHSESLDQFPRRICISSFNMIRKTVKKNLGISFVYKVLADSDPELGQFSLRREPIVREFNIVYPKYTDVSEKIDLFFAESEKQ